MTIYEQFAADVEADAAWIEALPALIAQAAATHAWAAWLEEVA